MTITILTLALIVILGFLFIPSRSFLKGKNSKLLLSRIDREQFFTALKLSPLSFICCISAFCLSSYMLVAEICERELFYLLATLLLAALFFTEVVLLVSNRAARAILFVVLTSLSAGFYYCACYIWVEQLAITKLVHLFLIAAVLPFVAPLFETTNSSKLRNRWSYILSSILLAAVCAFVVGFGASILLGSVHYLFNLNISVTIYSIIWLFCSIIIAPTFLLIKLVDIEDASDTEGMSCNFRFLSWRILLSFVLFYSTILYLYVAKILFLWTLPKGGVAWLVCSYALVGTLVWVLNWEELTKRSDLRGFFQRNFYKILLPLLGLLFVAIYERIATYGFTQARYFLLVLAMWIFAISIYFIFSSKKNLRTLTSTFTILGVFTFAGPWGAYSFPANSQLNRLSYLLAEQGIDPKIEHLESRDIAFETNQELSSILNYLITTFGPDIVRPLFAGNSAAMSILDQPTGVYSGIFFRGEHATTSVAQLISTIGLSYVSPWQGQFESERFSYGSYGDTMFVDKGSWDLVTGPFEVSGFGSQFSHKDWQISLVDDNVILVKNPLNEEFKLELLPLIERLTVKSNSNKDSSIQAEGMSVKVEFSGLTILIQITNIFGTHSKQKTEVASVRGYLLVQGLRTH